MTTYAWPDFPVNRFEMSIKGNAVVFTSPFTGAVQALELAGERWQVSLSVAPGASHERGAALEAFFDRLKGPINRVSLWNLRRPVPLGTLRDGGGSAVWRTNSNAVATWSTSAPSTATWSYAGPVLCEAATIGANLLVINAAPGTTLKAGDHVGAGAQLFRAMADCVSGSDGRLSVEVMPRVRSSLSAGASVTCTKPTAEFILRAEAAPITWRPGVYEGFNVDFIQAP